MDTSKCAEKMLITLVKEYEKRPGLLSEPGYGLDPWDLAARARIVSNGQAESRRQYVFSGGFSDNVAEAACLMEQRGWVRKSVIGEYGKYSPALFPTPTGIDHAHHLSRPFWRKFLDLIKGDVRTIVIAIVTAAVTAIVTEPIVKALD